MNWLPVTATLPLVVSSRRAPSTDGAVTLLFVTVVSPPSLVRKRRMLVEVSSLLPIVRAPAEPKLSVSVTSTKLPVNSVMVPRALSLTFMWAPGPVIRKSLSCTMNSPTSVPLHSR